MMLSTRKEEQEVLLYCLKIISIEIHSWFVFLLAKKRFKKKRLVGKKKVGREEEDSCYAIGSSKLNDLCDDDNSSFKR